VERFTRQASVPGLSVDLGADLKRKSGSKLLKKLENSQTASYLPRHSFPIRTRSMKAAPTHMTAADHGRPSPVLPRRLLIALIFLVAVGAAMAVLPRVLVVNDDNLWLAMATWKITAHAEADALENKVIDAMRERGENKETVLRFEQRRDYTNNYIGALALWRTLGAIVPAASDKGEEFAVALRLSAMFAGGILFIWLVFVVIVSRIKDATLITGLAFGLAACAIWAATFPSQGCCSLGLENSVFAVVPNIVHYLIKPPDPLTIFGFTGRNLWSVIFLAVVALRWAGKPVASAFLYACSFSLHSSMATLMLPFLLAADLLGQPRILLRPAYVTPLALGLIYGEANETLWLMLGQKLFIVVISIILIAAAAAILIWIMARYMGEAIVRPGQNVSLVALATRMLDRLAAMNPVKRDLVLLSGIWLATLVPAITTGILADPIAAKYFWFQIHSRSLGAFQPVLICGLATLLIRRYSVGRVGSLMLVCVVVAVVGAAFKANDKRSHPVATLTVGIESINRFVASGGIEFGGAVQKPQRNDQTKFLFEKVIYYGLERSLATGQDRLTPALAAAFNAEKLTD
jgi:hypothetical protein